MKYLVVGMIVVFGGPVLGWLLLAGFCNVPGIRHSSACGHNAYYWLPLFIVAGVMLCIFGLKKYFAMRGKRALGGTNL